MTTLFRPAIIVRKGAIAFWPTAVAMAASSSSTTEGTPLVKNSNDDEKSPVRPPSIEIETLSVARAHSRTELDSRR